MKRRNRAGAPAIEIVDTRMNPNDDPRELALARDGVRLARAQGYFLHGGYDGPVIVVTTGDRVIASAPIYSDWGQGFARFALAAVPGREDALPGLISELRAWARHELKSGELIAESPVSSVVPALRAAGYVQRGADWHRPIAANVNAAGGKRRNRAGVDVDTLARIARHARSVMREEFDGWVSLGKLRDPIGHAQVVRWLMERQNNRTDAAYKRNSERFGEREAAFRKGIADEAYDLLSEIMIKPDPAYVASLKKSNKAGGKRAEFAKKKGEYGTLFLFAIRYHDDRDRDNRGTSRYWAYDSEHAAQKFYDSVDSDGWRIESIEKVRA